MTEDEKYLGNPLPLKKKRGATFESLINKIESKIASWKAHLLSQAGRSAVIKSIASVIPVYNMFILHVG